MTYELYLANGVHYPYVSKAEDVVDLAEELTHVDWLVIHTDLIIRSSAIVGIRKK